MNNVNVSRATGILKGSLKCRHMSLRHFPEDRGCTVLLLGVITRQDRNPEFSLP